MDPEQVRKLARLGMNNVEIADVLGCSEATIRGKFANYIAKGRAQQKRSLRRLQWKCARTGNVAMLIFLGKNMLGQTDRPEVTKEKQTPSELRVVRLNQQAKAT